MASLLICTDIFGVTPDLKAWVDNIVFDGDINFLSPYSAQNDLMDERTAYAQFSECGGIDPYVDKISSCIKQQGPDIVIGFSAGAASAYKALSLLKNNLVTQRLLGFYPGQIRFFTDLAPTIHCDLFFANSEPHFDSDLVIEALQKHQTVNCKKTKYQHGFMNARSGGYSSEGQTEYTKLVNERLRTLLV